MNLVATKRVFVVLGLLCLVTGCQEVAGPIGHSEPVDADRLRKTAYLSDIKNDSLTWTFGESTVEIVCGESQLPADVSRQVLGVEVPALKVTATWELIDDNSVLRLTDFTIDDAPSDGATSVDLKIEPAGPIRVNIGERQYNLHMPR